MSGRTPGVPRTPRPGYSAVIANAVHPGVVSTALGSEDPGGVQRLLVPVLRPFMRGAARGAETSIHVASAPGIGTGRSFANSRPRRSSQHSHDDHVADRLWQASSDLIGIEAGTPG